MFKMKLPSFLPKEDRFCALLEDLSVQAARAAHHLKDYVQSDEGGRGNAVAAVKNCRNEAKRLSTEVTRELCQVFITPFDREDIQEFSDQLYKIPKTMEKIVERMELHSLHGQGEDISRQIELIVQEADAMEVIVRDMTHGKNKEQIEVRVAQLYELENRGDEILGEQLKALFMSDRKARDLILHKDIYDMLEKIIDRYRDAAGVALQIVLKHS